MVIVELPDNCRYPAISRTVVGCHLCERCPPPPPLDSWLSGNYGQLRAKAPWPATWIAEQRGVAFWFVLRLLIDTSAWLDMATRREGQKWIVPLRVLKSQGKLELLVPALIIEEFDRNRPRSESAVTTSVLDRLRQLRRELREYAGDKHEHIWLAETAQHIPLVNATAPQNFRRSTSCCGLGRSSNRLTRSTRGRSSLRDSTPGR